LGLLLSAALAVQLCHGQTSGVAKCGVKSEPCSFPFDYNALKKTSCIRFGDGEVPGLEMEEEEEVYCRQTQGRGKGKFASWSWGVCNKACLSDDGNPKECSGDSGASDCKDCGNDQVGCEFPFTYKGKEYNGCTDADTPDGSKWCATKVGGDGEVLRDGGNHTYFWGTCDMAKCHDHCEQADVDEVGEAEVTLKEGSIIIHEWKNQCKMNFSGELKDLEPNTEYSLWVTEASTSGCPDLNHEPTELTAVMTDDEGKATIPSTVTREIRLFGEDSAIGKMVVLESSSKGEVEGCGVIVRKEDPVDISIIIIVVLAVVIAILLCFVIGLCVYCCKKRCCNDKEGQGFTKVPTQPDTPDGRNGTTSANGPFGSSISIPWIDATPAGSPRAGRSTEWLSAHFSRSSSVGRSRGSLSDLGKEVQA